MPITIKELLASDTISQAADKVNFNFDQLLLNGGGPVGPKGPLGSPGPIGGRGIRGSQWFEGAADPSTIVFPDLEPNDSYLQGPITTSGTGDGDVWEYTGVAWAFTGINIKGPTGTPGTSEDWARFGNPIVGGDEVLYPVQPSSIFPALKPVPNDVFALSIGGIPRAITGSLPNAGYDIDDTMADDFSSSGASLYIHVPGDPDHINAIKFSGANDNSGNFDNYCLSESNLAAIRLGIGDRLIMQDSSKALTLPGASPANMNGVEVKAHNKNLFLNVGRGLDIRTGQTSDSFLTAESSEIRLWVVQEATGQAALSSPITLLNEMTSASAEFIVGKLGDGTGIPVPHTGDIFGDSYDTYFDVENIFKIDTNGSTSTNAIYLSSSSGGILVDGQNIELDANVAIALNAVNSIKLTTALPGSYLDLGGGTYGDAELFGGEGLNLSTRNFIARLKSVNGNIVIEAPAASTTTPPSGKIDITAANKIAINSGGPLTIEAQDLMLLTTSAGDMYITASAGEAVTNVKENWSVHAGDFSGKGYLSLWSTDEHFYYRHDKDYGMGIGFKPGASYYKPGSDLSVGDNHGSGNACNVAIGALVGSNTNNLDNSLWVQGSVSIGSGINGPKSNTALSIEDTDYSKPRGIRVVLDKGTGLSGSTSIAYEGIMTDVSTNGYQKYGVNIVMDGLKTGAESFCYIGKTINNTGIGSKTIFRGYIDMDDSSQYRHGIDISPVASEGTQGIPVYNYIQGRMSIRDSGTSISPNIGTGNSSITDWRFPKSGLQIYGEDVFTGTLNEYTCQLHLVSSIPSTFTAGHHHPGLAFTTMLQKAGETHRWKGYATRIQRMVDNKYHAWQQFGGWDPALGENIHGISWGTSFSNQSYPGSVPERMRLTSRGSLCINTSQTDYSGYGGSLRLHENPGSNWQSFFNTTAQLAVDGDIVCTGIATVSDDRLKENITPIPSSIKIISELKPITYTWKDKSKMPFAGFSAQETAKVLPDVVRIYNDDNLEGGKLGIHYESLIAYLTKGMQEQQEMIKELQEQVKELQQKA